MLTLEKSQAENNAKFLRVNGKQADLQLKINVHCLQQYVVKPLGIILRTHPHYHCGLLPLPLLGPWLSIPLICCFAPRLLHWENQFSASQRAQNSRIPAPRTQDAPLPRSDFSSQGGQGLLPEQTTGGVGSLVVSRHTETFILLCCFIWSRWAAFCRATGRLLQRKLWIQSFSEIVHCGFSNRSPGTSVGILCLLARSVQLNLLWANFVVKKHPVSSRILMLLVMRGIIPVVAEGVFLKTVSDFKQTFQVSVTKPDFLYICWRLGPSCMEMLSWPHVYERSVGCPGLR